MVERIACGRINKVAGDDDNYDDEWVDPSVTKGEVLPTAEETMRFSTLGMRTGDLVLRIALRRGQHTLAGLNRLAPTGDNEGDVKVGVGSSVDNADAPVSPRNSAPRLLDFRRGRGMSANVLLLAGFQNPVENPKRESAKAKAARYFLNRG